MRVARLDLARRSGSRKYVRSICAHGAEAQEAFEIAEDVFSSCILIRR